MPKGQNKITNRQTDTHTCMTDRHTKVTKHRHITHYTDRQTHAAHTLYRLLQRDSNLQFIATQALPNSQDHQHSREHKIETLINDL